MRYEDLLDLIPAYALDMLDPAEKQAVETGLAQYPELRKELQQYQTTVDQLALLVPIIPPPADLGDRLMQRIKQEQHQPKIIRPQFNQQRWALAAAALFVVILGILLWQFTRENTPEEILQNTAEATLENVVIASILENSEATWIRIEGSEGFTELAGALVIAPDHTQAVLQLENLALLPPEQTYQLWLVRGEEDRASGLLFRPETPDPTLLVSLPDDFETFAAIGVTIEPAGGSPGPTSDPVFAVLLPD